MKIRNQLNLCHSAHGKGMAGALIPLTGGTGEPASEEPGGFRPLLAPTAASLAIAYSTSSSMPNRHHRVYLRGCPQINQLWPWLALLYNLVDELVLRPLGA